MRTPLLAIFACGALLGCSDATTRVGDPPPKVDGRSAKASASSATPTAEDTPPTGKSTKPMTPAKPAKRVPFAERAPRVGDPAPKIALGTVGGERVTLPIADGDRPAVLIFGSFT